MRLSISALGKNTERYEGIFGCSCLRRCGGAGAKTRDPNFITIERNFHLFVPEILPCNRFNPNPTLHCTSQVNVATSAFEVEAAQLRKSIAEHTTRSAELRHSIAETEKREGEAQKCASKEKAKVLQHTTPL